MVITGRIKDIIIRKGENIPAKEAEDVLDGHPKIAEVAVIGLPDREAGELCCAVVVVRDAAQPLTFAEMSEHCLAEGLARHMVPERLEVVDVLPRNVSGKVVKHELQRRFGESA